MDFVESVIFSHCRIFLGLIMRLLLISLRPVTDTVVLHFQGFKGLHELSTVKEEGWKDFLFQTYCHSNTQMEQVEEHEGV